jgi:pimeloyl-ACP methyl ester carboxylesterase
MYYILYYFLLFYYAFYKSEINSTSIIQSNPSTWIWKYDNQLYNIHYENYTNHIDKPNIVLIHGFGSSSIHWRNNLPELSKVYNVFAFDLLGFGKSDKPIVDYNPELWQRQIVDFINTCINKRNQSVILVGNSIGGYLSTYAAVHEAIKPMIKGIVLINTIGIFKGRELPFMNNVFKYMFNRPFVNGLYYFAKNNVRELLTSIYPKNPEKVDNVLVQSIENVTTHPNASEVFYRVIKSLVFHKNVYMEDIVRNLTIPIFIITGKKDPFIQPWLYSTIKKEYFYTIGEKVDGGHCPQDEIPDVINNMILLFMNMFTSIPNENKCQKL